MKTKLLRRLRAEAGACIAAEIDRLNTLAK